MNARCAGFLLSLAAATLVSAEAHACSVVVERQPTRQELLRQTRALVAEAAAVIDGEVVRAVGPGGEPAMVRVTRLFKGPRQALFAVGASHSCDLPLTEAGRTSGSC